MVKRTLSLLFFSIFFVASNVYAKVTASVDNQRIAVQQTFRLTIDVDNQHDINSIDLSPLQNKFQIVGRSTQSSFSNINGRMSNKISLVLTLIPLVQGDVKIPSLTVGNAQTDPIQLHISKLTDLPQASHQQDVLIKASVDKNNIFVQQQITYTLKLYVGTQISRANLIPPTITKGDAVFEPIGKGSHDTQIIKGKKYVVYTYQYGLTPQKSGEIKISPAIFKAQKADPRFSSGFDSMFDDFFNNPLLGSSGKPLTLASNAISIKVKSIPSQFHGKDWLPATSMHIFDEWDKSEKQFKVGEPITRTITVNAEGLSSDQLPELNLSDVEGIKQYASKGERHQEILDGTKLTSLTTKVTIIPTTSGKITLP